MIMDKFSLKGKVAVVTGANTGLGQGMCVALAQAGAKVAGVARRSCEETKALIEKDGGEFLEVIADLGSTEPIQGIIDKTVEKFGKVDILVNNAGIILREDAINVPEADWDKVITINQKVVFFMCQAFAKEFEKIGGGKIVNVASMLSYQGGIRVPAYTASKSAILGLTRALANEWASKNINVNAIAPGYMATKLTQDIKEKNPKQYQEITSRIPAGRWGTGEDLKGLAVFLASDASAYISGAVIPVDGGYLGK